jgi:hypothetical protein
MPEALQTVARGRWKRIADALERKWVLCVGLFVEIYLLVTALHGLRRFWYDELFTFYVCRLPGMGAVWAALKEGVDLNPPLFYAATRACQAVFGSGELGTRVPAILGFLGMSLCIFRFVSRYGSRMAALAAMTFPVITGTYYYASEARAYGMVLGFSALAAVFWQAAARGENRRLALPGLAAALAGALLSHCYAVLAMLPFAIAEAVRLISRRKIDWPMLAWLAAPCPVVLIYLPMFAATRGGVFNNSVFRPTWSAIPACYVTHFAAALWPALAAFAVLALARTGPKAPADDACGARIPAHEIALGIGFALAPVFGVLLAMTVTGVFMDRYGVPALVGCSILMGALVSRSSRSAAAAVLAIFAGAFVITTGIWVNELLEKPAAATTVPKPQFDLAAYQPRRAGGSHQRAAVPGVRPLRIPGRRRPALLPDRPRASRAVHRDQRVRQRLLHPPEVVPDPRPPGGLSGLPGHPLALHGAGGLQLPHGLGDAQDAGGRRPPEIQGAVPVAARQCDSGRGLRRGRPGAGRSTAVMEGLPGPKRAAPTPQPYSRAQISPPDSVNRNTSPGRSPAPDSMLILRCYRACFTPCPPT